MSDSNEKKYKEYANEELSELIRNMIPKDKYGDFTELVYDIILRRSYTFDLSKEHIVNDIHNLLENCETIRFSDNFKKNTVYGHILLDKKICEINEKKFENDPDYEKMYEILTHELYHAMAKKTIENNKVCTGLKFFDSEGNLKGSTTNEIFNECAADMATRKRKEFKHKTIGYNSVTFIGPLLAHSLGVPEKELYSAGLNSREEFIDYLKEKQPEYLQEPFLNLFENFEFNADMLYKLSNIKNDELTEDDKRNIENYLTEISGFAINVLYSSIVNDKRDFTVDVQKEYEARRKKVYSIIKERKEYFKPKMFDDANARIEENIGKESKLRLNMIVFHQNYISRLEPYISSDEKDALHKCITSTFPSRDYKEYSELRKKIVGNRTDLPTLPKIFKNDDLYSSEENTYQKKIISLNYDDFKEWDNSMPKEKLKELFEKYKER
jgi:hypothetical protein